MVEMDVVMTPIGASGVGVPFELASRRTCDGERSELAQIQGREDSSLCGKGKGLVGTMEGFGSSPLGMVLADDVILLGGADLGGGGGEEEKSRSQVG